MREFAVSHALRLVRGRTPPRSPEPRVRRHGDDWLRRWMRTTEDLADLQYSHRMVDAVIDEVEGRADPDR